MEPLAVSATEQADGTWTVVVGHVNVRHGLSRDEVSWWLTRLPQEVVSGTPAENGYRNRRFARERIAGVPAVTPETVTTPMGVVRPSADRWGFGLYEGEYRYWFRTRISHGRPWPGTDRRPAHDVEWIQTDGLPVVTSRTLVWVGLNPSNSDDDPKANRVSLSKVVKWATREGMNEVLGVNLFAYRHTDPKVLGNRLNSAEALAVIGEHNDRILRHVITGPGMVLAAWGSDGTRLARGDAVREWISVGLCLGLCANGEPKHPARLAQATPLVPLPSR